MNMVSMIGDEIHEFEQLDSTNKYVAKTLERGQYDFGTVILAHFQSEGVGQRGAPWQSAARENLTFSFGLPLAGFDPRRYFLLSMAISLALVDTLRALLNTEEVFVKWPNDVFVEGGKVAGILIESTVGENSRAICGIGLNVNQTEFQNLPEATSMKCLSGVEFSIKEVLRTLLKNLNSEWHALSMGDFRTLPDRYRSVLLGYQKTVTAVKPEGSINVFVEDVELDGRLVVRMDGETHRVSPKMLKLVF